MKGNVLKEMVNSIPDDVEVVFFTDETIIPNLEAIKIEFSVTDFMSKRIRIKVY